jgi:hypothetical protein
LPVVVGGAAESLDCWVLNDFVLCDYRRLSTFMENAVDLAARRGLRGEIIE